MRFTSKSYEQSVLQWNLPNNVGPPGTLNYQMFQRELPVALFWEKNQQFLRQLFEYQWIKFNYIAVKVTELSYFGFTNFNTDGTGVREPSIGITMANFDRLPMYFCWDLEEDMSFTPDRTAQVDPESLSQYPFTKKMYPGRTITFLYRFPKPWRQFIGTYYVRNATDTSTDYWSTFMEKLTGVKNLRGPKRLLGTHMNMFLDASALPNFPATGVPGKTVIALNFYMGCTFKGRSIMATKPISNDKKPGLEDENDIRF